VEYTYFSNPCQIKGARGHRADVCSKESLAQLGGAKYDAIVHSAALTNVDLCEKDRALAHSHNVEGTANALGLAMKHDALFAYVSTSHVFPASDRAYKESDKPDLELAPNYYGRTKLEGEMLIQESGAAHLILRIDQPYYWKKEWHKHNTVTRTLERLQTSGKATEVEDWFNCPTFVPSFCDLAASLMEKGHTGIFHAAGPDFASRLEWGRKTAMVFGYPEESIVPITSASLNLPVVRPNVRLDSSKAYGMAGVENVGLDAGLERMLKERKE